MLLFYFCVFGAIFLAFSWISFCSFFFSFDPPLPSPDLDVCHFAFTYEILFSCVLLMVYIYLVEILYWFRGREGTRCLVAPFPYPIILTTFRYPLVASKLDIEKKRFELIHLCTSLM